LQNGQSLSERILEEKKIITSFNLSDCPVFMNFVLVSITIYISSTIFIMMTIYDLAKCFLGYLMECFAAQQCRLWLHLRLQGGVVLCHGIFSNSEIFLRDSKKIVSNKTNNQNKK
jgi:hypothetical protein